MRRKETKRQKVEGWGGAQILTHHEARTKCTLDLKNEVLCMLHEVMQVRYEL